MEAWPSYAKVLLNGFEESADYGVLRTNMDSGLPKQRKRFGKAIVTRSASCIVTKEQMMTFKTWVKDNLDGGVLSFTWTDPLDKTPKTSRIVGGKIQWNPVESGYIWKATFQIESLG